MNRIRHLNGPYGLSARLTDAGEWVLLAAFLLTPLTTLRPVTNLTFGDCLLVLILAIAVALVILRRRVPVVPRWVWAGSALLFLSIAAVEIFPPLSLEALDETFSGTPYASSLAGATRLMVALVVFPVAIAVVVQRWATIGRLVNAWIIGVSLSCGVALVDAVLGLGLQLSLANNPGEVNSFLGIERERYVGLSVHPTSFSVSVAMVSPLVLGKMTDRGRVLRFFPLFVLLVCGVILSGSRGGLVGIALATVLTIALNSDVRHAIFPKAPKVMLAMTAGLATAAALLVLGPLQSTSENVVQPGSGATIDARVGKDRNWVRNPNLAADSSDWASFGETAEVSRIRLDGTPGRHDRWVLKTVTKGNTDAEGHTVVTEVEVPGTYTASLNVLARPGVIYELRLQQYDNRGEVSRASSTRFTGTGRWQKPRTKLRFGPNGPFTVLNLLTVKWPQATTFLSYSARVLRSGKPPQNPSPAKSDDEDIVDAAPSEGSDPFTRFNPFGTSVQSSNSERVKYLEDSLKYIAQRPVPGYGFQWIEVSHNIFLQLVLSGGLVALLGYVLVIAGYFREGIRLRSRVSQQLAGIDLSLMISLAAFLVMGLVQTDLLDRYLYLPVALILSISSLLWRSGTESSGESK